MSREDNAGMIVFECRLCRGCTCLVTFLLLYVMVMRFISQEEEWGRDPNEFVSDEDDELLSCRTSGGCVVSL